VTAGVESLRITDNCHFFGIRYVCAKLPGFIKGIEEEFVECNLKFWKLEILLETIDVKSTKL
jgi:hypothetical protein